MNSERERARKQFRESNMDFLKMAIDSISDMGVLVTDMDGRIIVYNSAASFYDRIDEKTAIGMHYSDIYRDEDGGLIAKVMKSGQPIINTVQEYTYSDGSVVSSLDSIYPIYIKGEMKYILAFTRYNVLAQKQLNKAFVVQVNEKLGSRSDGVRYNFDDILGDSNVMKETVQRAKRGCISLAPTFIEGETGTGKELFAQSIHNGSPYKNGPFVAVNCAAIPENLLESTLFGTTKGAFTGADNKPGLFEQAKNGTFFLDEINSMPMYLQAKLLRVIQEKKVRRIGANKEVDINGKIIASCNRPSSECLSEGIMRSDLYYRLSVIKIEIPPLRTRKEDIQCYIEAFAKKFSDLYDIEINGYTKEFYDAMISYDWPGNVRELEHVIESAVIMINGRDVLEINDLPMHISLSHNEAVLERRKEYEEVSVKNGSYINSFVQEHERQMIIKILEENNWNVTHAARIMEISRSNLQYRMKKYDIRKPEK